MLSHSRMPLKASFPFYERYTKYAREANRAGVLQKRLGIIVNECRCL